VKNETNFDVDDDMYGDDLNNVFFALMDDIANQTKWNATTLKTLNLVMHQCIVYFFSTLCPHYPHTYHYFFALNYLAMNTIIIHVRMLITYCIDHRV
jgi:hypothetical protein